MTCKHDTAVVPRDQAWSSFLCAGAATSSQQRHSGSPPEHGGLVACRPFRCVSGVLPPRRSGLTGPPPQRGRACQRSTVTSRPGKPPPVPRALGSSAPSMTGADTEVLLDRQVWPPLHKAAPGWHSGAEAPAAPADAPSRHRAPTQAQAVTSEYADTDATCAGGGAPPVGAPKGDPPGTSSGLAVRTQPKRARVDRTDLDGDSRSLSKCVPEPLQGVVQQKLPACGEKWCR